MNFTEQDYTKLYNIRFSKVDATAKQQTWQQVVQYLERTQFPKKENLNVLDLGAGDCEFINHVSVAKNRWAVDCSDRIRTKAASGVQTFVGTLEKFLTENTQVRFDVVFLSNFLEHLESWREVQSILRQVHQALLPGGRIVVLGPNYRFVGHDYWNYPDHILPLNESTVDEHLQWAGFKVVGLRDRFLPFSFVKSKLPPKAWLVRLYLKLPIAWKFLGKQFLVTAEK